jgi:hypothetical protein
MDVSPCQDYLSVEMSGGAVSVLLNQGTINLWFGRNAEGSLVSKILLIISKVASSAEHEREAICSYEEMSLFENCGYILISYARRGDKYRAVFLVPFSDPRALERLIESVCHDLVLGDARMTITWKSGRTRMNMLHQELIKLNCFSFSNITYKDTHKDR